MISKPNNLLICINNFFKNVESKVVEAENSSNKMVLRANKMIDKLQDWRRKEG